MIKTSDVVGIGGLSQWEIGQVYSDALLRCVEATREINLLEHECSDIESQLHNLNNAIQRERNCVMPDIERLVQLHYQYAKAHDLVADLWVLLAGANARFSRCMAAALAEVVSEKVAKAK